MYAYPHKVPGLNHVQEVYISENNMVIQTEGTEIWVSGRQDTRITGWGDTRPDNGKDWAYDAESVYPLPMLNNTQTDYQDAVASVGLGAKQVILLTMEYDQYTENGAEKELLDKHVYMLGQDTQSLLGTLLQTEETEETETTGNTEAYVNEPTEYSFFNITELERLKELAQEALETLEKNGNRYDGDWQIKWNTFNAKYAEARAALVAEGITDPSDREIRAKLDKMAVGDTMLQIIIDYCNTNPDWVLVALNMAGQNVIKAQREVRAAEETLAKSEKSKSDRDAVVASWAKLMAEVQASNEYLTYKPLLDEQQAALKAYDEAKTNYNTAVEEAATAASTLTAAVTAQKAAAEKYDEIKDYNDKGQATDWELKQAEKAKDDAIKALENAQADNAAKQTALQNATQVQAAAKTRMDQANDAVNNSADKYAFLTLLWTLANTEEYKGTKENPGILYDYSGTTNSQFIENTILDYSILAGHQARAIESAEDAEKQIGRAHV